MLVSTIRPNLNGTYALFPLTHNWRDSLVYSYEFKTDIIEADEGNEQRRAVRNEPRRSLVMLTQATGANKAALDRFLYMRQSKATLVHDFVYAVKMLTPPAPGSNVGSITEAAPAWLKPGANVVIVEGHTMETRLVEAMPNPTTIVFDENSPHRWGPDAYIAPMLVGHIEDDLSSDHPVNVVQEQRVTFEVDPGTEKLLEYFPGDYLDWREILMLKPDWSDGIEVNYQAPREDVDFGFGVVSRFERFAFPRRVIRADFIAASWEAAQKAIDFFCRCQGRLKEFLLPTWENDIDYDTIVGGTSQIIVRGQEFALTYQDSRIFRRVMFRMQDGTYIHRSISDILALPETDASVITLSEALPAIPFNKRTMHGISWVMAARFATDRLEIEWLTSKVGRFRLTFQTLENSEL